MSDRRNELDERGRMLEDGYLEQIERHRVLWANTGNPVHVWHAISCCFAIGMLREQGRSGQMPAPPWTEASPFPDWCMGYLSLVSARVDSLAEGKDFRRFPEPIGEQRANAASFRAARHLPASVTGAAAASLLPRALGIVRDGGNAFDDARSLFGKEMDAVAHDDFIHQTDSASAAMRLLLEHAGADDPRSMQKRLDAVNEAYGIENSPGRKRGRKSRAKPPP